MTDYDDETRPILSGLQKESHSSPYNPRLGFVRKVYSLVTAQLLLTLGISIVSTNTSFGAFQLENVAIVWALLFLCFAIFIVLACFTRIASKVPINYILMFGFTFCLAYDISYVVAMYQSLGAFRLVITAVALTVAMTAGLTLYACFTKTDFTTKGGILCCCSLGLCLFFCMAFFSGLNILVIVYCTCSIILYGIYIVFDTQLIMGGKRHGLSLDDYVLASISLYLDILVLFLEILRLLTYLGAGGGDSRK